MFAWDLKRLHDASCHRLLDHMERDSHMLLIEGRIWDGGIDNDGVLVANEKVRGIDSNSKGSKCITQIHNLFGCRVDSGKL